jgi:hypothetical protein
VVYLTDLLTETFIEAAGDAIGTALNGPTSLGTAPWLGRAPRVEPGADHHLTAGIRDDAGRLRAGHPLLP